MFEPKKILVPTDFSRYSDVALRQAVAIAQQHKSKLYLLHVIGMIHQCSVDYCIDNATVEALEKKSIKTSKEMMEKQVRRVAKSGDVEIITDVRKGTPYKEILKEQENKKIDLIVIAAHGKTGILGHLMGIVAEKVSKHAKCAVYMVRGK